MKKLIFYFSFVSLFFLGCSPKFTQTDCNILGAGYNYETRNPHCCESSLWKADISNSTFAAGMQNLNGKVSGEVNGILSFDLEGKSFSLDLTTMQEKSAILATHYRKQHCPGHEQTCEKPFIKLKLSGLGQVVIANISSESAGVAIKDALKKGMGLDANFNASSKTVSSTTGRICLFFPDEHRVCEGTGIIPPPGDNGYYLDGAINTQLSPAELDSLRKFARGRQIRVVN